jgi:hypothetical protein
MVRLYKLYAGGFMTITVKKWFLIGYCASCNCGIYTDDESIYRSSDILSKGLYCDDECRENHVNGTTYYYGKLS